MTTPQKVIKYLAMALAIFLVISIIGGILGTVGVLAGIFSDDIVTENVKRYDVTSEIRNLDIAINAADLCIKEGDAFWVESNLAHLKVKEKDGTLLLEDTQKFGRTYQNAVLTLCVPAGTVFDKVNLTTGAGRLTMDSLSAGVLDFELGAGDVTITSLTAVKSADIEGGAGRMTVCGGALRNLDLEMGVGQLNLTAALTGDCQMELGVGESNITLLGQKRDYALELEKGIGSITVDGETVTGFGSVGSGKNRVEITGGIGAIHVKFAESEG